MPRNARSDLFLVLFVTGAWACSGSRDQQTANGTGAAAGTGGSASGTGGKGSGGTSGAGASAGSGSGGTAGGGTGGASGAGSGAVSGAGAGAVSGAGVGGTAGAGVGGTTAGDAGTSGSAGSSGSAGTSAATACSVDTDCVVAATFTSTGCCSRQCGVALNGEWVANEPCATTDPAVDPVPASCSTGCTLCPAADPRCLVVHGAVCAAGACTLVTDNGPCAADEDCVLAIDWESTRGACCDCPLSASKATLEHDECIVPVGEPQPAGCDVSPSDACDTAGCPAMCGIPTTRCVNGSCGG